jgi:hypothetical protein
LRNSSTNIGKEAFTILFAFLLQPINPALPRSVVHVYPAENGKGILSTVSTLLRLRNILLTQFHFRVVALAFDDDSWLNIHCNDFALV